MMPAPLMGVRSMPSVAPASRLLALWLGVTVVVCLALAIAALVVARQSRALSAERAREVAERTLHAQRDGIAARLTAMGSWLGQVGIPGAEASVPDWADRHEVLVLLEDASGAVAVHYGCWLFTPDDAGLDVSDEFLALERREFADRRSAEAIEGYRSLTRSSSPDVRAGAYVRLARVLAAQGDTQDAIATLAVLSALPDGTVDGAPAALVGRFSRIALLERAGRREEATELAREVRAGLDEGRWPAPEGVWRFYGQSLERLGLPASLKRNRLALALAARQVVAEAAFGDEPRVVGTDAGPVVVVARVRPTGRAIALFEPGALLPREGERVWLLGRDGHRIAERLAPGDAVGLVGANRSDRRVTLPIGSSGLMVQAPVVPAREPWYLRGDVMAVTGTSILIACVLAGSWGLLRGIRREAQLNALQSHFIAAVSHELRTPVTSLRYMADMLGAQRVPPENLPEYYAVLGRESRRLQLLIEGLLQFGRLEAGTTRLQRDRIDAWRFTATTVEEFEATRDATGARARMVGSDPGLTILADRPALAVALRNLLDNAVKYSPGTSAIDVSCEASGNTVSIRVRDFGLGLTPTERQDVFRRFTRGSAAERTGAPGTGLGLALAQHIASVHAGALEVESAPGAGSVFTLRLPVAS